MYINLNKTELLQEMNDIMNDIIQIEIMIDVEHAEITVILILI